MAHNPLPDFQAISSLIHSSDGFEQEDVEDDLAGEKETLPDLMEADLRDSPLQPSKSTWLLDPEASSLWRGSVAGASKAITDKTEGDYRRIGKQCTVYLLANKFILKPEDLFCSHPPKDTPLFLISWIMNECDEIQPLDGTQKPAEAKRGTYGHAQKLRAAMTHIFGRVFQLGTAVWTENLETGTAWGNPSISHQVSAYMMSLRNRKAHLGETPTSARAITKATLQKLHDFNHEAENWDLKMYDPGSQTSLHQWGGPLARRELQAIYTIAFLCLLRSDEVLKIQAKHISFTKEPKTITLTLPFRKTHQDGGIKPFVLYAMDGDEAFLCPVRAMAEWIEASGITSGFLFRKIASGDRPSSQGDACMTSEQFLELFRNNLLDVKVDSASYGTHSFRRGGCQYLSAERRWGLRSICEWGGWSTEFSNLTIVRYLISWNDDPTKRREDFFNPALRPAMRCFKCGRSCHCA